MSEYEKMVQDTVTPLYKQFNELGFKTLGEDIMKLGLRAIGCSSSEFVTEVNQILTNLDKIAEDAKTHKKIGMGKNYIDDFLKSKYHVLQERVTALLISSSTIGKAVREKTEEVPIKESDQKYSDVNGDEPTYSGKPYQKDPESEKVIKEYFGKTETIQTAESVKSFGRSVKYDNDGYYTVQILSPGQLVLFRVEKVKGIITGAIIRNGRILYEVDYFSQGTYQTATMNEFEFTLYEETKAGFKS